VRKVNGNMSKSSPRVLLVVPAKIDNAKRKLDETLFFEMSFGVTKHIMGLTSTDEGDRLWHTF